MPVAVGRVVCTRNSVTGMRWSLTNGIKPICAQFGKLLSKSMVLHRTVSTVTRGVRAPTSAATRGSKWQRSPPCIRHLMCRSEHGPLMPVAPPTFGKKLKKVSLPQLTPTISFVPQQAQPIRPRTSTRPVSRTRRLISCR